MAVGETFGLRSPKGYYVYEVEMLYQRALANHNADYLNIEVPEVTDQGSSFEKLIRREKRACQLLAEGFSRVQALQEPTGVWQWVQSTAGRTYHQGLNC